MESAQFGLISDSGEHDECPHSRVLQFECPNGQPEGLLLSADFHPTKSIWLQEMAIRRGPLNHSQMASA
jgi:hypothetical protein